MEAVTWRLSLAPGSSLRRFGLLHPSKTRPRNRWKNRLVVVAAENDLPARIAMILSVWGETSFNAEDASCNRELRKSLHEIHNPFFGGEAFYFLSGTSIERRQNGKAGTF